MTNQSDLLDHAVELFPAPEGALQKLYGRRARHQRNRRLTAGAAVVVIWAILAASVVFLNGHNHAVPGDTPSPDSGASEIIVGSELPSWFPADVPLPPRSLPVAHRDGQLSGAVWFSTPLGPRELDRWFWNDFGRPGVLPGMTMAGMNDPIHYDTIRGGRVVNMVATSQRVPKPYLHGSDDLSGGWDFYIQVAEPDPATTPPLATVRSSDLPTAFPADVPLPAGAQPVAHRERNRWVQVWFRCPTPNRELDKWFPTFLEQLGWSGGELGLATIPMHLDYRSHGRWLFVIGGHLRGPAPTDHGSGAYRGTWDFSVRVTRIS